MTDAARTITFASGNLPGNPHSSSAHEFAESAEVLALVHEKRTANLIALLNTPDVPTSDRSALLDAVYKNLGIEVTKPGDGGAALNL